MQLARVRRIHTAPAVFAVCLLLTFAAACRSGVPVLDANGTPPAVMGTITGTVSGEDGKSAVAGRKVTAVNVDSGARESAVTSSTGGFTFKVPAGRYRVEVELIGSERVISDKGHFYVGRSELEHDVDIRIGSGRRPATGRIYQPPLSSGEPLA
jgi:hypothetical protein